VTVLARFAARGHPRLRATHGKTLELTAEAEITERATCVVGVAAELPDQAVAGPVRLTLSAAGHTLSWLATGNSGWQPGRTAVIRRSGRRLADTFATDAELAADGLPRELVRELAAGAAVTVTVERAAGPAGGTLVRLQAQPGAGARLRAEAAAADLVVAEDAPGRALAGDLVTGRPPEAAAVLAGGGRVLAVGATGEADLSGPLAAAARVEVLGLPAEAAVSAAAADRQPALVATRLTARELAPLAGGQPGLAVVLRCPAAELPKVLATLGRDRTELVVVTPDDPERPVRGRLSEIGLPDRGELVCRAAGRPDAGQQAAIDPVALVRELLAQAVTPRSVALAVAALPGWSRRTAYAFVLSLSGETQL